MLNMNEILEEIEKLENTDCTTYDVCQKLAILYTVKNYYKPQASQKKSESVMPNSSIDIAIK